ncbi:MAG: ABC transporter permease [Lachnospirales bacterium]
MNNEELNKEFIENASSSATSEIKTDYDAKMFEFRKGTKEEQEEIVGDSLNFFQDAFRRLRKNKVAMVSLYILIFILFMAIFAPNFNEHRYDWNVQDLPKEVASKLPPRIPGLEKIGIMNGTTDRNISVKTLDAGDYPEGSYDVKGDPYEYRGMQVIDVKEHSYIKNEIEDYYYWFGTDDMSRDLWTRVWLGARISLYIGLLAAFIDITIGLCYGLVAGYFGGKVDMIMMRITEIVSQIPNLVILVLFMLLLGSGIPTMSLAIALTGWTGVARVVRAQVLRLRQQEFILASRTLGANSFRIISKHLFPNIIGQIIIMATFSIPSAIFYEAFLSLIGLGLPAPMASIGTLINDGRAFINTYPHMILIPSILISILMISINMFANGLRDALDPKMKSN